MIEQELEPVEMKFPFYVWALIFTTEEFRDIELFRNKEDATERLKDKEHPYFYKIERLEIK